MRLADVRGHRAKLGMTVNAAPTGNVEPEGRIAREYHKAAARGRELAGTRLESQQAGEARIPRVKPPAIVPPSKRRVRI